MRPQVAANLAMSADGKIASVFPGVSRFTSEADRAHMDMVRHDVDAVLIGGHTLRQANPVLTVRRPEAVAARLALGLTAQPRSVVVTATGALDPRARIFNAAGAVDFPLRDSAAPLVLTTCGAAASLATRLGARAQVLACGSGPLGAEALLAALWQQGVRRLLIEGGGEVLWTFVQHGALDALHVTLAPCLLGGAQAPTLLGGTGFSVPERMRLRLTSSRVMGDELFVSYSVVPSPL